MRIRKYDFDYGRRALLQKAAIGAGAGVLAPLWANSANGDVSKAYPDELLHIEAYTKGKIKPGDMLTANNVDVVKDLLDPITVKQVKEMNRTIKVVDSPKEVAALYPADFLDVSLKNKGKAKIGADGNIYNGSDGNAWAGGLPFLDAKTGEEAIANLTLSWGRHDYCQYAIRQVDFDPSGNKAYNYDFVWAELQVQSRVDQTVFQNKKDLLRLQSVWFTAPQDTAGSSFLSTWYYDQRKFPDLYGYLPAFKRVRQFPTNQRFEPLLPGITWFLSDAWAAGDPMLTWGNYKIVGRQPMLAPVTQNTNIAKPNWDPGYNGGPKGQTFFNSCFSLVPECIVLDAEPVGYPRAPVGKKRVWIDTRNMLAAAYVTFDRRGEIWKSFEGAYGMLEDGGKTIKDGKGHTDWSWGYYMSHDIQANRMSRGYHAESTSGGYKSVLSAGNVDVYNKYLTNQAITRLGQA